MFFGGIMEYEGKLEFKFIDKSGEATVVSEDSYNYKIIKSLFV